MRLHGDTHVSAHRPFALGKAGTCVRVPSMHAIVVLCAKHRPSMPLLTASVRACLAAHHYALAFAPLLFLVLLHKGTYEVQKLPHKNAVMKRRSALRSSLRQWTCRLSASPRARVHAPSRPTWPTYTLGHLPLGKACVR